MTTVLENKGFTDTGVLRAANLSDKLRTAKRKLKKSPGHFTAVDVQKAKLDMDAQVEKNRNQLRGIT